MSSDRLGKYRERPARSRTPYARPKGLIRRVTDKVSGLLGSSWIPGFLRGGDEEETVEDDTPNHHSAQQPGPSGYARSNSQHLSSRSPAALYPEEAGGTEAPSSPVSNSTDSRVLLTATTHQSVSGVTSHHTAQTPVAKDSARNLESVGVSRIFPESSFRENSSSTHHQQEQLSVAGPTHANSSGNYKISVGIGNSTGLVASTPQYNTMRSTIQQQQHNTDQQKTRVAMNTTPARPASVNTTTPIGSASTPSARLGSAQSNSKRPRFSLSAYSAAASPVGNKSVLSDGSFRSSPFYPGRTIYGGAAAYRRTPTPVTPRSATASPRVSNDGGLSEAAQRILSCLNSMSTPLTDAKRIPTPSASPYTSYLESPYTAAFHKHRPNRPPPAAGLSTPTKVSIQSNMSQYVGAARPKVAQQQPKAAPLLSSSSKAAENNSVLDPAASSSSSAVSQTPSIFSVAAASATRSASTSAKSSVTGSSSLQQETTSSSSSSNSSNPLLQPSRPLMLSTTRLPIIPEVTGGRTNTSSASDHSKTFSFASNQSTSSGGAGKIKSIKQNNSRGCLIKEPEFIEPPALPNATLPKIVFNAPINLTSVIGKGPIVSSRSSGSSLVNVAETSKSGGSLDTFHFSVPEVMDSVTSVVCEVTKPSSQFRFSAPSSVLSVNSGSSNDNFVASPKYNFVPKVKSVSPKKISEIKELNTAPSDLLDFLSKTSEKGASEPSKTNNSFSSDNSCKSKNTDSVQSGWGDKFKIPSGSWECASCMIRNLSDKSKCVACETPKPGTHAPKSTLLSSCTSSISSSKSTAGFGDMFKKAAGQWDCDMCMLRNKEAVNECVACNTARPGVKKTTSTTSASESQFSFGVGSSNSTFSTTTPSTSGSLTCKASAGGFRFGATTTSSATDFSFGIKPVTSSVTTTSITSSLFSASPASDKNVSSDTVKAPLASSDCSFGAAFKKGPGDWECPNCLLNNKSSMKKCPSCETSNPVASTTIAAAAPTATLQGFGDKYKKAAGDWECDACLVNNKASVNKCVSCESPKPGSVDTSKLLTGNFKFGATNNSDSSFKFGVAACNPENSTTDPKPSSKASSFLLGQPKSNSNISFPIESNSTKKAPENGKPDFSFGILSSKSSNGGINCTPTFSTNCSDKTVLSSFAFTPSTNISPSLKTTSVESIPTSKPENLETSGLKNVLNNTNDKLSSASTNKETSSLFQFGSSNSIKPVNSSFNMTGNNSSSVPKQSFAFGGKTLNSGDIGKLFQTSNSVADDRTSSVKMSLPTYKESTSNKRCHSPTSSQNNGVAESNLFGKSNSTGPQSIFSFGQSATGAKSTTTTFGAPSFTNNNNNTITDKSKLGAVASPVFAFGQSAEKKPTASFEFGQAAAPAPSFNFGGGTPNAPFAFQAPQSTNNGSNGNNVLFQFGNAATTPSVPSTFGGAQSNIFSQPTATTPSGRIMKRAIRRTKK